MPDFNCNSKHVSSGKDKTGWRCDNCATAASWTPLPVRAQKPEWPKPSQHPHRDLRQFRRQVHSGQCPDPWQCHGMPAKSYPPATPTCGGL